MESATSSRVPPPLLRALRCRECGGELEERPAALTCAQGHSFPDRGGWFDFSPPNVDEPTRRTLRSFGYEWTSFGEITEEEEAFWWERNLGDVPLDGMAKVVGLDAGCGKGRFSRLTAPHLAALVALDGSDAVHSAAENLSRSPNVVVVKSDVRSMPLEGESVGLVMCLGVLHHLPDPLGGFRELVRVLAPGGRLVLYLYSRPDKAGVRALGLMAASALRRVTPRVPLAVLRSLCAPISAALYAAVVLPGQWGARKKIGLLAALPLDTYRGRSWRSLWLDTFDRLSAPVEFRYVWSELQPWFDEAGLDVVRVRDEAGFFIQARKTATGDR